MARGASARTHATLPWRATRRRTSASLGAQRGHGEIEAVVEEAAREQAR